MFDVALIEKCADPSLTPAIVGRFVEATGSPDPLAVTVKSGGRLILVPTPKSVEEAMGIVRDNIGRAVVRVGLTQFPAGVGIKEASELKDDIVDPCENLRMDTRMFAKIMRIVANWYGNPTNKEDLSQIFDDAVYSWKTGEFEGASVFQTEEPETRWAMPKAAKNVEGVPVQESESTAGAQDDDGGQSGADLPPDERSPETDSGKAGIRVDLSRINGK